jgi:hypothetical protein
MTDTAAQTPNTKLDVPASTAPSRSVTPYSASLSDLNEKEDLSKETDLEQAKDDAKDGEDLKLEKTRSSIAAAVRSPALTLAFVLLAVVLSIFLVSPQPRMFEKRIWTPKGPTWFKLT